MNRKASAATTGGALVEGPTGGAGSGQPTWRRRFDQVDRSVGRATRAMSLVGALAAMVIMLAMSIDVAYRLSTGGSIPGAFEIVEVALVMAVFMGMANAERTQTHVRVTLVTARLPRTAGELLRILGLVVSLVIVVWFAWSTGMRAIDSVESGEYKTGLLDFPLWPGRTVIAIGFTALALEIVMGIARRAIALAAEPTERGTEGSQA